MIESLIQVLQQELAIEKELSNNLAKALKMALEDHSNPEWPYHAAYALEDWEFERSLEGL